MLVGPSHGMNRARIVTERQMMDEQPRKVTPLIDLTAWDKLPESYQPLPGQLSLLGDEQATPAPYRSSECWGLFDAGHDLPGANETEQAILWDVGD